MSYETTAYDDCKPGTSGVRKKTKTFMQKNYLENFVQSCFNATAANPPHVFKTEKEKAESAAGDGSPFPLGPEKKGFPNTLLIAGDGRFWNDHAIQVVTKIALANGVQNIWIGDRGIISTPAASAVIRKNFIPYGAFLLTASHNPPGVDNGISYSPVEDSPSKTRFFRKTDFGIKYNSSTGGADDGLYKAIYTIRQ